MRLKLIAVLLIPCVLADVSHAVGPDFRSAAPAEHATHPYPTQALASPLVFMHKGTLSKAFYALLKKGPISLEALRRELHLSRSTTLSILSRLQFLGRYGVRLIDRYPMGYLSKEDVRRYAITTSAKKAADQILDLLDVISVKNLNQVILDNTGRQIRTLFPDSPEGLDVNAKTTLAQERLDAMLHQTGNDLLPMLRVLSNDPTQTAGLHVINGEKRENYSFRSSEWPLLRQVAWDDMTECAAVLGFHVGRSGVVDGSQTPVGWMLFYPTPAGTRLRIRHMDGAMTDEAMDKSAMERRHLSPYVNIQNFVDSLLLPRSVENEVTKRRTEDVDGLANYLKRFGKLSEPTMIMGRLPEEHRPAGTGTPIMAYSDHDIDSRYRLMVANKKQRGSLFKDPPMLILYRRPGAETMEIFSRDGRSERVSTRLDQPYRNMSLLSEAALFRWFLSQLSKTFIARKNAAGSLGIGVGRHLTLHFKMAIATVVIRRPGEVSSVEGSENARVLVLSQENALLARPLSVAFPDTDDPVYRLHQPQETMLEALEKDEGLLLPPYWVNELSRHAVFELRTRYQPRGALGDEVELWIQGHPRPAFVYKTYEVATKTGRIGFSGHVNLYDIASLAARGVLTESIGFDDLTAFAEPNWPHVLRRDAIAVANDPSLPPWVLRMDDLSRLEKDTRYGATVQAGFRKPSRNKRSPLATSN